MNKTGNDKGNVLSMTERATKKSEKLANLKTDGLPEGFSFGKNGLNYIDPYIDSSNPIWVCSRLEITAMTHDQNGDSWGRVLEFTDRSGRVKKWVMPMEMLAGRGDTLHSILLSMGLTLSNSAKAKNLLSHYIQACEGKGISICVDRLGWHKECYVLPDRTIGDTDGKEILYQTDFPTDLGFSKSGTLGDWKHEVARFGIGNSRIAFAISAAFTAPLLSKLGGESIGFHFRGDSSNGKTVNLYAAGSVWGSHERKKTWRATSNGLEVTAFQHNDGLLLLDEMGEMNPREIGQTVYMLVNGQAKQRHNDRRPPKKWRLMFLSTGELNLKSIIAEGGGKIRAGQEVRLIDLEAVIGELGIFETLLEGFEKPSDQVKHLREVTNKYYGTAGIEFIRLMTQDMSESLDRFKAIQKLFTDKFMPEKGSSQVGRALDGFGIVAAGGEMATEFGLTGWERGEAMEAAYKCFQSWLSSLKSAQHSQEEMQALEQVRGFIERYGESRFTDLNRIKDDHAPRTLDRAGYRGQDSGKDGYMEYVYYFSQTIFKEDVCNGISWKTALNALKKHGHLKHQPNRNTQLTPTEVETGKRISCYAVRSSLLDHE